jgi:hypothetical protein
LTAKKKLVVAAKRQAAKQNLMTELPAGPSLKDLLVTDGPRAELVIPKLRLPKRRNVTQLP